MAKLRKRKKERKGVKQREEGMGWEEKMEGGKDHARISQKHRTCGRFPKYSLKRGRHYSDTNSMMPHRTRNLNGLCSF